MELEEKEEKEEEEKEGGCCLFTVQASLFVYLVSIFNLACHTVITTKRSNLYHPYLLFINLH